LKIGDAFGAGFSMFAHAVGPESVEWLARDERRSGRASAGKLGPLSSAPTTASPSILAL